MSVLDCWSDKTDASLKKVTLSPAFYTTKCTQKDKVLIEIEYLSGQKAEEEILLGKQWLLSSPALQISLFFYLFV